jgi:transcriptional regulator of acetoin/glycerol metabolism
LLAALQQNQWNRGRTAANLGISRWTLRRWLRAEKLLP